MKILSTILLAAFLLGVPVPLQQEPVAIILAPSIHQLDPLLEYDLRRWLDNYRPGGTHIFAVMSQHDNDYGVFVSLAGLDPSTPPPYDWRLEDGNVIWTGTLKRVSGQLELYYPREQASSSSTGTTKLASLAHNTLLDGPGGGPEIVFPWQQGTKMQYGTRGVHGGGFNFGSGLDFISGDDMGVEASGPTVYASADGEITDVCEDGVSTGIKVESAENTFAYFHLQNDESLTTGATYKTGSLIGSLVPGSFDSTCGWAAQQPNHYHLHWVVEMADDKFTAEGWLISSSDGKWRRGNETVSPGKWMLGGGGSGTLDDDPLPGGGTLIIIPGGESRGGGASLWDYLLTAVNSVYGLFKTWYVPTNPVNDENEKMWVLAINMIKTMIKDANIYLVNDTLNILPLVWMYIVMLFLDGIKWLAVIALTVFNFVKDFKGLVATS